MSVQTTSDPPFVYQAARVWLVLTIAALLVFLAVTLVAVLVPGTPRLVLWVGVLGILFSLGGIVEALVGRITLESDSVVVNRWFRTERVLLSDVAAVRQEGGQTSLRLKTGEWKRLPEWLAANKSLGKRIRDRLQQSSPN